MPVRRASRAAPSPPALVARTERHESTPLTRVRGAVTGADTPLLATRTASNGPGDVAMSVPPPMQIPPPSPPPPRRVRRGRKRKLPIMSNSERAKYYRRKNAESSSQLDLAMHHLRREVCELGVRVTLQRQLATRTCPDARVRILERVWRFVTTQLDSGSHGLRDPRTELISVVVLGDADAPIVQIRAELHGQLVTRVVHDIYPFVLGNSVILDELMHRSVAYPCLFVLYFAPDGSLQRQQTEVDAIHGLREPLHSLATVARVLEAVNVHEPVPMARRKPSSHRTDHVECIRW